MGVQIIVLPIVVIIIEVHNVTRTVLKSVIERVKLTVQIPVVVKLVQMDVVIRVIYVVVVVVEIVTISAVEIAVTIVLLVAVAVDVEARAVNAQLDVNGVVQHVLDQEDRAIVVHFVVVIVRVHVGEDVYLIVKVIVKKIVVAHV